MFGSDGRKEGFLRNAAKEFKKVAKENGLMKNGSMEVIIAKDAVILKQGLLLSTRKEDKNRLVGCIIYLLLCLHNAYYSFHPLFVAVGCVEIKDEALVSFGKQKI